MQRRIEIYNSGVAWQILPITPVLAKIRLWTIFYKTFCITVNKSCFAKKGKKDEKKEKKKHKQKLNTKQKGEKNLKIFNIAWFVVSNF